MNEPNPVPHETPKQDAATAFLAALAKLNLSGSGLPRIPLGGRPLEDGTRAFEPYQPAPGVRGKNEQRIAMDSAFPGGFSPWFAAGLEGLPFQEGYTFLGYPYLSQLAQIPEYRLISETIATEATRKWIGIKSVSEDKSKTEKIKELETEMDRLGVRKAFRTISEQDGFFGRSHLYLDTGDTKDRPELKMPLGDGGKLSRTKIKKGGLRALKTVEPVWCYPSYYEAADPLTDSFYRPDVWFVNGTEVHASRLLTFVARPVPDLIKPAFSFGGLSLTQMAKSYVDNWLQTRQSVNDLIQNFSIMILSTDMQSFLSEGGDGFDKRIALFNLVKNNKGAMVVNKDTEDLKNVSAPLSGLDHLQAQALEHICSVAQIPLVKYTGISPSGLNASSDGEIRAFYDRVHAYQEAFFGTHLRTVFRFAQINIWGEVDEDLEFFFKTLWELDDKSLAEVEKTRAETHRTYIDIGAFDQEEVRRAVSRDPDQPYGEIVPADVPDVETEPENIHETEKFEDDDNLDGGGTADLADVSKNLRAA